MKRGLPVAAWILIGLLIISASILTLGRSDNTARPEGDSFSPSGTSALVELLRRSGYEVRVDRRSRPRIAKDEVAVAFLVNVPVEDEYSIQPGDEEERKYPTLDHLEDFADKGGRVLTVNFPRNFDEMSRPLLEGARTKVTRGKGKPLSLAATKTIDDPERYVESEDSMTATLWWAEGEPFMCAAKTGDGVVFTVHDGTPFSNRFIDRADDEAAALAVFQLAAPNKKVVFTEASFTAPVDPGLIGTIGQWAVSAWYQLLALGVVVIYTLGKRFGRPERVLQRQLGTRQLLDALADTQYRGKHASVALRTTIRALDADLRTLLRLPRDGDLKPYLANLPDGLREAVADGREALKKSDLTPAEALNHVRRILDSRAAAGKLDPFQLRRM